MSVRRSITAITAVVALAGSATGFFTPGAATAPPDPKAASISVLRVKTTAPLRAARQLQARGFDLVETRIGKDLLVVGDAEVQQRLTRLGYTVTVQERLASPRQAALIWGGYKTADDYLAYLDSVAASNPTLATTYDVGDSWLKTQGATQGNDIKVICLTKKQPGDCQLTPTSTKPRFFLMGTVHARELSPTELADRWITELVTKYGTDADITALMDSMELWVLPLANPDGREIAEQNTTSPYLQRKNANGTAGGGTCANPPTVSNQAGVDINRNHSFGWGGVGTSTAPCAQTYRGTSAASEPETQALENLMVNLFADNRGPASTDAAPVTTPGMMMTLHSHGNLVLFPWGDTSTASPNDAGLRSMGFRLNYFNGYTAGQPGQVLYNVSGATDDWAYGTLGVASSTVEIGPSSGTCSGFTPAYSCQTTFWNSNRNMLVYAAKLARQPYALSLGPNTRSQAVSPTTVTAGSPVTLTATGQDSAYGTAGVGRPTSQVVNAGRYYLDTPPWAGGTAVAMTATDGTFNSTTEGIRATVPTTGLTSGKHVLYVQSRDSVGNWGAISAVSFTVS
jgi:carboxypeptidase T